MVAGAGSYNPITISTATNSCGQQCLISIYLFAVLMYVLGISAYYHNAAAALVKNGRVVCAAEEERFIRIKFDSSFPTHAIAFCLATEGITLADVDAVVYYEKPLLKFERIVDNFYKTGPAGYRAFLKYMPLWSRQKLFMRHQLAQQLKPFKQKGKPLPKLLFSNHHLSHAASSYYCSGFDDAAILTADGAGEWATAAIAYGKGNQITTLAEMHYPHSVGLFYSAFTQFLGFAVNSGEYKLMGLAPYAHTQSVAVDKLVKLIKQEVITIFKDGSIKLNLAYFNFPKGFSSINLKIAEQLLGIKARKPADAITITHATMAMAVQRITEEVMLKMAATAQQLTGSKKLCLAGGVALNCVANSKILQQGLFDEVFIQPAAGDAGGALGAALAYARGQGSGVRGQEIKSEQVTVNSEQRLDSAITPPSYGHPLKERDLKSPSLREYAPKAGEGVFNPYLGPSYNNVEIKKALQQAGLAYQHYTNDAELNTILAKLIAQGKVIGRFSGAAEWGPRALGNRSIFANPQSAEAWARINQMVKQRENFRPFAPAVLAADAHLYFEDIKNSSYMLYTFQLKQQWRLNVIAADTIESQMAQVRSAFPAITHIDYSARVQTVDEQLNPGFYYLLQAVKAETGHGMLLNTSFNRNNEPIVNTPQDAIACYLAAGLDALVLEGFLVCRY